MTASNGPSPTANLQATSAWCQATVTANRAHRVAFTHDAFHPDNPTLRQAFQPEPGPNPASPKALFVFDQRAVSSERLAAVQAWFDQPTHPTLVARIPLPGGEDCKNQPQHLDQIHQAIFEHHLDRRSYILALGGGALLDLAGYAAATAHRGVRIIRLPSTTLAQCDSGVGVKNAVNRFGIKNALGTFAVPHAVVNDFRLLRTLPDAVWQHGFAECVKVALLKDAELFRWLENHAQALAQRDEQRAEHAWQRSAQLHLDHIATGGDPFEQRQARPLDFGHWAAHRLEELSEYQIPHGPAVALGLTIDLQYAARVGLLNPKLAGRAFDLLEALGLPTWHPLLAHPQLPAGLEAFRQHLGGQLTITTIRGLADPIDLHTIDPEALHATLAERATQPHTAHAAQADAP